MSATPLIPVVLEAVVSNLTPDLLLPEFQKSWSPKNPTAGFCSVASEAVFFLLGGGPAGWKAQTARDSKGVVHWWLAHDDGRIVDPTSAQYTTQGRQPPYSEARGGGFQGMRTDPDSPWGFGRKPSARAARLLERIIHPSVTRFEGGPIPLPEAVEGFLKRAVGAQHTGFVPVPVLEKALEVERAAAFSAILALGPEFERFQAAFLRPWLFSMAACRPAGFLSKSPTVHAQWVGSALIDDLLDAGCPLGTVEAEICREGARALRHNSPSRFGALADHIDTVAVRLDAHGLSRTLPVAAHPAQSKAKL